MHNIGCVSFLNSKPLIDPVLARPEVRVHFAVPAHLLDLIEADTVSTALMSVVDFQTARTDLLLLPVGMIGCDGPTLTVRIYSRVPVARITALHTDTDSHTSIILAQVILRELHGLNVPLIPLAARAGDPPRGGDVAGKPQAMLLIGDKVVNAAPDPAEYPHQLDLGEEWKRLTGLPFVFAMWMIRQDHVAAEGAAIARILDDARRQGAALTDQLLDRYAAEKRWPRDLARKYFTEYLRYEVTPRARLGLARFFELAHRHSLLPRRRAVEFFELPVNPPLMTQSGLTAVQLTAPGPGAIAVILLAGTTAATALQTLAQSPRVPRLAVGAFTKTVLAAPGGMPLDDALVVRTGADRYELHLHGGTAVVNAVLQALHTAGARVLPAAEAGDLLGSGIDAELQLALPQAVTETALRLLLAQPRAWAAWTTHWRHWLSHQNPGQNPAANLWQLHSAAQWLLERSTSLVRLLHPARIAIIGPPNSGKSTLANALLGRRISITSDLAGTTRDWVDAQAVFMAQPSAAVDALPPSAAVHAPVILVDTAGVRSTHDELERASIARTHHQAARAEVIILLFDATRPPTPDDLALQNAYQHRPLVIAANKIDALHTPLSPAYACALPISAKTHAGLDTLMAAVLAQLDLRTVGEECFAFSLRREKVLREISLCNDAAACAALLVQLA